MNISFNNFTIQRNYHKNIFTIAFLSLVDTKKVALTSIFVTPFERYKYTLKTTSKRHQKDVLFYWDFTVHFFATFSQKIIFYKKKTDFYKIFFPDFQTHILLTWGYSYKKIYLRKNKKRKKTSTFNFKK